MKQKFSGGDEFDRVYSSQYYSFKPGARKRIKRRMNKRFRREGKVIDESTDTRRR